MYLTKSAFRLCLDCETKLAYLMANYPRSDEEDEYLEMLAEGGFIVGTVARARYPAGKELGRSGNPEADFQRVREALRSDGATLFEATLLHERSLAVADIVERRGDVLRLVEVKSKSFAGLEQGKPFRSRRGGGILSEWRPYIHDIAFQCVVAAKCFPEFRIEPSLLLVDTSKRTTIDGLPKYFSVERSKPQAQPLVRVRGESAHVAGAAGLLSEVNVSEEVELILPEVREKVERLERSVTRRERIPPRLSITCRKCEFRGEGLEPSGYSECWRDVPTPEHHIFDLYRGTTIKTDGRFLLDDLIGQGKASLLDVPLDALKGKQGERQRIQIERTRSGEEWFAPQLGDFLGSLRYPLHFIDFETTRTALPFHAGMRPFEQLAFQWSCHTVEKRDAAPVHTEWINTEPRFPNFEFARTLMRTLSKEGTVLTWASHEGTTLQDIIEQMGTYEERDPALQEFLSLLVSSKGSQGRLVDMNRLAVDGYFHPEMKGQTSIKKVFPAVWRTDADLRKLPWFAPFEKVENGNVVDPYAGLPPLVINGVEASVREGTAAMLAYEEMLFGDAASDAAAKQQWTKLLLQYCELDTLAMVAIWEHWERLAQRER